MTNRTFVVAASAIVLVGALLSSPASAQTDELIGCDAVRNLGNAWRNTQSGRNVSVVACYVVPGAQVQAAGSALAVEIRVTSGAFDVFIIPSAAAVGAALPAQQLSSEPIVAGSGWQQLVYAPLGNPFYTIAVAPSVDGVRGSFQLRLRAVGTPPPPAPPVVPTPLPPATGSGATIFPTTTDRPCSVAGGFALSNFCIETWPVVPGSTAYAVWRITDFRYGEFDRGDGQGFRGPIASQMRVEVPNVTAPRLVRLRWFDTANREYIDSIVIQTGTSAPTPAPPPPAVDTFPCSRAGIGVSNLCIEQPYPVPAGNTAYAVWRIVSFRSGEFDKGDGRGFRGPISAEQRVEIPNVTGPRTIRLRWVDLAGVTREDSFTIQTR
ncbi:MAG: hypothetical protein NZM18_02285 [Thermoflexales bacterium]|nr:hypothetical protein [Thermoflexales bacterium]MDW8351380.1 hypothetical protein [Anaerolineae bacterium]